MFSFPHALDRFDHLYLRALQADTRGNALYTSVYKWTSVLNGVCTFNLTTSSAVTVPWYESTCTDIKLNK